MSFNNYFSIFQETFLKYFSNIPRIDEAIHCGNVTEKHFMKYYRKIFSMFLTRL